MTDDRLARGERVRREVLGDDHVDRATQRGSDLTRPFQEFITGAAWADVWGRPNLDRRTRSAITLAVLTALGARHELPMHVRAARRHGLSAEEIAEILLHTAIYAGLPRANEAFAIADEVLREGGEEGG
jgi:4-carboxymuconolactone decarboxylase